jgi:hypothetical protein
MLLIYLLVSYFGGEIGRRIIYPIRLLVTFLHEFGHALGALFTGGSVSNVQINADGSGFTKTMGGSRSVILMGGYIGSAILGNILLLIGAQGRALIKPFTILLSLSMLATGIFWFNSFFTTGILILFAVILIFIALKTKFSRDVLLFLGLASIIYIIQDFNVGPSSDLQQYASVMKVLPPSAWMYIWLAIAIILLIFNLRLILKIEKRNGQ